MFIIMLKFWWSSHANYVLEVLNEVFEDIELPPSDEMILEDALLSHQYPAHLTAVKKKVSWHLLEMSQCLKC